MKNNCSFKLIYMFCALGVIHLQAQTLTFSKAYELALENSNKIKSSQYQYESKKEKVEQVKSEFYPQINSSISYSDTDFEYNNLRYYEDYYINEKTMDYMISLSQVIYNKELNTRLDTEKLRLKMTELDNELKKQELAQELLKAYLDLLKSYNKRVLLESYLEYTKFQLELFEKKYQMNLSSQMDFLQAKVDYDTAKVDLTKEINLEKVYRVKLINLIGIENFTIPSIKTYKFDDYILKDIYSKVADKENFINNLEIQQAKYGVEISKNSVENSYAGHYPKVNLDLSYTKYDSDSETTDYENTKRIMVSLKLPLYSGGYVTSKVSESKLNLKSAKAELEEMINEINARYKELLTTFKSSIETVQVYVETLKSTQLYLESVMMGVQSGLKSKVDVFDAQYKLNEVKYKYIENIYNMMDSYISLLIVSNDFSELKLLDTILITE